mgnify:CR=1 FL=1
MAYIKNGATMFNLKLTQISQWAINSLSDSFDRLPKTDHRDGSYRLRKYSSVQLSNSGNFKYEKLESTPFNQSVHFNKYQGGVDRNFEEVEDGVIESGGMLEICDTFLESCGLTDEHTIDIHQMRISTDGETVPVSPEGVHQDGYRYIAIVGVNRHNIEGGDLLVYKEQTGYPFLGMVMQPGEMVIVNDKMLWHSAKPIRTIDAERDGYMDAFILTAG